MAPVELARESIPQIAYRVVRRGVDPLSTAGSERNGGRYHDPGVAGVLYTSTDRATAIAEVVRGLQARGIDPDSFGPQDWWVYELRVSLDRVLDVADPESLAGLKVTASALFADNTEDTRRIGRQARDAGFQALLAPSAAVRSSNNLVLFLAAIPAVPEVISSTAVELSKL